MFDIHEQVICIRDDWRTDDEFDVKKRYIISGYPVKGQIYTIRDVIDYTDTPFGRKLNAVVLGLIFEELTNMFYFCPYLHKEIEMSWIHFCFKPVKKTSIDCFKGILTPYSKKNQKVRELELT